MFDPTAKLTIDCPNGHSFEGPPRELRGHTTCPVCGQGFDGSQFDRDVRAAERKIRDFEKSLGPIRL